MKPARFEYHRPASTAEAIEIFAGYDGNARFLAGGQSLVPLMNFRVLRPTALIDLNRCAGLDGIERTKDAITVGAMVRQGVAETSDLIQAHCPLVTAAMPFLGSRTIRNRGTVGGTIAHADRSAELPAVAVALGAVMVAQGPNGSRDINAGDFYLGDLTNALEADEMLKEIRFPLAPPDYHFAFVEATNRHHDLALLGLAVSIHAPQGRCTRAALVIHGGTPAPQRLAAAERCLVGQSLNAETIAAAAAASTQDVEFENDLHAPAEYRHGILPDLLKRALHEAAARSSTGF